MSLNCGQLGVAIDDEEVGLFPYPKELTSTHFSKGRVFNSSENAKCEWLQVEFRLISPIEFSVYISRPNHHFKALVLESNKGLKFVKNSKLLNIYEMSLKHYVYVLSKVKYLQYEVGMTINHNWFFDIFINALIKNLKQNDDILAFIENRKRRNSIIESLKDSKFGKTMKMMSEHKVFDGLYDNQTIAFYMSVIRNGRCILADKEGKSLTALMIMTYFKDDWPLVIVCDKQRQQYWKTEICEKYKCGHLFRVAIIRTATDIYVYPKPFHHIMIINYDFYYEIKDTLSFRNINIRAYIFEDQSRGLNTSSSRQWKGLSKAVDNLKNVNRLIFISSKAFDAENCKRLWPLLQILDPNTFQDFEKFENRYCDPSHELRDQMVEEIQILLRSTFFICNNV